jgi:hypothetical protein
MVIHALTEVREYFPTSSYITYVIMMTIFHGFACRCMAFMMRDE